MRLLNRQVALTGGGCVHEPQVVGIQLLQNITNLHNNAAKERHIRCSAISTKQNLLHQTLENAPIAPMPTWPMGAYKRIVIRRTYSAKIYELGCESGGWTVDDDHQRFLAV